MDPTVIKGGLKSGLIPLACTRQCRWAVVRLGKRKEVGSVRTVTMYPHLHSRQA